MNKGKFEYSGFVEVSEKFKKLSVDDKEFRQRLQKIIGEALEEVRRDVMSAAQGAMKSDPRQSYMAVRRATWQKLLGGNVNILNRRKGGATSGGGGSRTQQINSYTGADRGFILRFLNSGTGDRYTGGRASSRAEGGQGKGGYRGSITALNFMAKGDTSMSRAASKLAAIIEEEFSKQFNNG